MFGGREAGGLSEVLSGKFGSKLEAATETMMQLDQHIQELNRNVITLTEEVRRSRER